MHEKFCNDTIGNRERVESTYVKRYVVFLLGKLDDTNILWKIVTARIVRWQLTIII